jgi:CBS domain-containing protein
MWITNWMTRKPLCVTPQDTLEKASSLMATGGFRQLPVVEGESLVGIITDRDLRGHGGYFGSTRVDAAMTRSPITLSPFDSAESAARLMIEHKIGAVPVVENGQVVGIVSRSDLLKALLSVVQAAKGVLEQ